MIAVLESPLFSRRKGIRVQPCIFEKGQHTAEAQRTPEGSAMLAQWGERSPFKADGPGFEVRYKPDKT